MAATPLPLRQSRRLSGIGEAGAVLALLAFVLLIRSPSFGNPVGEMDEQLYSFIGWRMLHGELPFVDWWDRKPFGLFALFAGLHAVGGPGPLAYQIAATLSVTGGAYLTYRLALPLADRPGAVLAGVFFALYMTYFAGSSGQSEAFHVPLIVLCVWLLRHPAAASGQRRGFIAMALCGLALQLKYTVLPQCIFFGLWFLAGRWRAGDRMPQIVRTGAIAVALGIAPTALAALLYAGLGEFAAFRFANFESFFLREAFLPGLFHSGQLIWVVPMAIPLLGAAYYALRVAPIRDRETYLYYAMWSGSALLTVIMPSTLVLFYFAALAPCVALLATPFYARATVAGMAPAVGVAAFLVYTLDLPERFADEHAERAAFATFVSDVAPHVDADRRCLFVFDGPTALYRETGACTLTTRIYPDHLNNALETGAIGVGQTAELQRILAARPAVIVTASRAVVPQNEASLAVLERVLEDDYVRLAEVPGDRRDVIAWVAKGSL